MDVDNGGLPGHMLIIGSAQDSCCGTGLLARFVGPRPLSAVAPEPQHLGLGGVSGISLSGVDAVGIDKHGPAIGLARDRY